MLLDEARERGFHPQTLGADKGYDTRGCVGATRGRPARGATHDAPALSIDARLGIAALSQRLRKRVLRQSGRVPEDALPRSGPHAGYLVGTAYNLVRMARLMTAETPVPQAA